VVGLTAVPVFTAACTGCGACLLTCPTHAIRPTAARRSRSSERSEPATPRDRGGALYAVGELCTGCGECVEVCPADAVNLPLPADSGASSARLCSATQ
jgi:electron transport complex protein RnfB